MFDRLNDRERRLVLIAILILGPLLLIRGLILPILHQQSEFTVKTKQLTSQIKKTQLLGQELLVRQRSPVSTDLGLNTRVARVLQQTNITAKSSSTSQGADGAVERILIQLDNLTLTETTLVIYQLEHLRPKVSINTLDLQNSFQNPKRLKLNLVVSSQ